ncbi:hypothetical protein [Mesorhizobium huakuii]|uniref:Uncharacterized protein n=1 Tax=Mesorhizobium huakuii TaxID=28104 RepID=A0A7G6T0A6_9HYPH|nr:hypothetical protein [Mesorhizobium huakuii]QND60188.1 hypothetical protein HB778_29315 [Mesorhizobium huakuii]
MTQAITAMMPAVSKVSSVSLSRPSDSRCWPAGASKLRRTDSAAPETGFQQGGCQQAEAKVPQIPDGVLAEKVSGRKGLEGASGCHQRENETGERYERDRESGQSSAEAKAAQPCLRDVGIRRDRAGGGGQPVEQQTERQQYRQGDKASCQHQTEQSDASQPGLTSGVWGRSRDCGFNHNCLALRKEIIVLQ